MPEFSAGSPWVSPPGTRDTFVSALEPTPIAPCFYIRDERLSAHAIAPRGPVSCRISAVAEELEKFVGLGEPPRNIIIS